MEHMEVQERVKTVLGKKRYGLCIPSCARLLMKTIVRILILLAWRWRVSRLTWPGLLGGII